MYLQDTLKPTYASILQNNTNIASNSIKQNTNPTGERPTLQEKLQSFTSKHSRSRSKSPIRKASKTNQQNQSNEIVALKTEIEEFKQQKQNSNNTEVKTHEESNSISENSKTTQHPKNVQEASEGGQSEKVELLSVVTFIKETMKTLATFEKLIRHQSDPDGNIINLTKHSFTKAEYKLLNKNLNFIPNPKVYNKNELDTDLNDFFRRIKLKAYFKDTPNNKNDDESRLFKQNKNKKWTPPNNHHIVNTYVEAAKKDIKQRKTVTPRKIQFK